ncbi:MT-A70 family methyltransferase [Agrobacterium tumefaciens]|uniref:MT-A70 family methyltransferase n=1 Tax=Agrobacterium tumefaciens TaxID=358 RepID=UPI001CBD1D33|nr:MT-A70 family methyltransferase [Agrobacterium tumefaciens]MDP9875608.1 N6-adenosine-specific RNA methylase IME4 [Agrobacterium tumefaciens]
MEATEGTRIVVTGPYQLLPPLSDDDFKALYDDIKLNGVKVPVEYDDAGEILDGHHRVAICKMLGLTDWPRFVRHDLTEEKKRSHARSLNFARRHLSGAQKQAVIEAHLKDAPEVSNRAIARDLGVDHKTVSAARQRLVDGGEIPHHEKVVGRNGVAQPIAKPIRTMFLPEKQNVRELKKVAKAIRTAEMKDNRASRLRMVNIIAEHGRKASAEMPRAAYAVGYADPPWEQEAYSDETGQDKGLKYPSMPLEQIKALCAGDKSPFTKDAVLFLWVTANRLADGLAVLQAWGFEYVTCMVWDKRHIGMGRWVRDRHELVLIAKRGNISMAPLMGTQPESLYAEAKTEHSRKPVWFAERIDGLWPELRKLELFQRKESLTDGDIRLNGMWDFWGFEAGDTEQDDAPGEAVAVVSDDDPLQEKIVSAGLEAKFLLELNRGLTTPGTLDLPSRLFRFPIEFMSRQRRNGAESKLLLRHPLLREVPQVAAFIAEVEAKTGCAVEWEPLAEFGRDLGAGWRWYHATDLCNDKHWRDLLSTQMFTDPDCIFRAVGLALNSRGALSTRNARALMVELGSVEPADRSAGALSGKALFPYRDGKKKFISPNISLRDEAGAWLAIHGIEDKWLAYVGSYLSVTEEGMARREAAAKSSDEIELPLDLVQPSGEAV